MKPDFFRLGSWLGRPSIPCSLIPEAALVLDRRQTDFFRRTIRQLIRHGAWEEAWALIELSTEVHRYNPAFHRACERARHRLIRLLFSAPPSIATAPECHPPPIPDLRQPFVQLSQRCEDALLQINPQGITHWGCVIFPGISRGRFQGPRQKRFCNAVVD